MISAVGGKVSKDDTWLWGGKCCHSVVDAKRGLFRTGNGTFDADSQLDQFTEPTCCFYLSSNHQ